MIFVVGVLSVDVREQLHLVQGLVEEVLVVLYDLHAHVRPCRHVVRLDGFTERGRSQEIRHQVTGRDHGVEEDREVFLLLESASVFAGGRGGGVFWY